MSLTTLTYIAADLIALAVLVGALYAPRHSRKDLMAAYIGVNVGVLAVTLLLSTASVAAGLGLGLFGVLSIIRLRSTELAQHEVAYFFAALALGLLGGIKSHLIIVAILMTLILYLPQRHKPYKDAEKLALKDDNDAPINPRQPEEQNKRQEK